MAPSNLAKGRGWFRIWLVLSLGWWLWLLFIVIIELYEGRLPTSDMFVFLGLSTVPFIVYAIGWISVRAIRWIRDGFREDQ